ncbi:hypothetical protein RINTHH_17310 [Richelia intracellularis HH01]|uniref:Uncharacterized protein n=1 Tax=Richelia intracellularis HH01 TaxID=1165094 RepID=M1X654_9NOST|nr:hypothetical protein [Richelia intracellularis]CCH67886.1 hypothetical protein RINTHH_17310 [Richelia intracellularis HH01]
MEWKFLWANQFATNQLKYWAVGKVLGIVLPREGLNLTSQSIWVVHPIY